MGPSPRINLQDLYVEREKLKCARLAPQTLKGYRYDAATFRRWCEAAALTPLPATTETVSLHVVDMLRSGKRITTAWRRVFAIAHEHRAAGVPSPINQEIYDLLNCAQRLRHEKPRQMRPLTITELRAISAELHRIDSAAAIRNRAILVLAYTTALRRSSIAALQLEDVEFTGSGLVVTVEAEKQDQEGRGRLIGVPPGKHRDTDAIGCLNDWLEIRGRAPGPLFWRLNPAQRSQALDGMCIYRVVKECIRMIGISPKDYGPHSTRAGLITEAAMANIQPFAIAAHSGHRSIESLRLYFRRPDLFRANVCAALDL